MIIWILAALTIIGLLYVNRARVMFALGWLWDAITDALGSLWPLIVVAWAWIRNHIFYFFCVVSLSLIATSTGMIFEIPWLTGLGMLLAVLLFLMAWTPVGISLRLLRVTSQAYPQALGGAILAACTLGLFGVYYPEYISDWRFIIPTFLLLVIFLSFAWSLGESYKIFNWLVLFAALGMTTLVVFRFARPDLHRATGRYLAASEKYAVSHLDRSSLDRQADALATFAIVREDSILYDNRNSATKMSVKTGQTVLVVKIKEDLPEDNGMSEPLIQIVLQDQHGNFVSLTGTVYKIPRSKLGNYMVASNIYNDPYIKLPKIIILTKKGEFGGTLPFKEDQTVMITVKGCSSVLKFPNGGRVGLPVGSQPYSVKKGEKLLFVGDGDCNSTITVSN